MVRNSVIKILIVDDDSRLRHMLTKYLLEQHFQVKAAANAQEMDRLIKREHYNIMVLDLMLPGEDGLSICRRIRAKNNNIPILILSAKGSDVDKIVGLEIGADDYLAKPFNPRELVARIKSLLRRQIATAPAAPEKNTQRIQFGNYVLDLQTRQLFKAKQVVPLTSGEFAILKILCKHPHEALSRDKLMVLAKGRELQPFDRSIDIQISRLRRIIELDPAAPSFIQTIWGFGYVFVPDSGP